MYALSGGEASPVCGWFGSQIAASRRSDNTVVQPKQVLLSTIGWTAGLEDVLASPIVPFDDVAEGLLRETAKLRATYCIESSGCGRRSS